MADTVPREAVPPRYPPAPSKEAFRPVNGVEPDDAAAVKDAGNANDSGGLDDAGSTRPVELEYLRPIDHYGEEPYNRGWTWKADRSVVFNASLPAFGYAATILLVALAVMQWPGGLGLLFTGVMCVLPLSAIAGFFVGIYMLSRGCRERRLMYLVVGAIDLVPAVVVGGYTLASML